MSITIELPLNFAMLNGEVSGPGRNGARFSWQKINGPASYLIEKPDSLFTKVSNLEVGVYQFMLTAETTSGEYKSDTMTLIVQNASSPNKQIHFWNLNWLCPFGCSIWLGFVSSYFSVNTPITVYIKREGTQSWDIVVPDSVFSSERYFYSITNGQLCVFEDSYVDATDHPEIKIVF
jgi:hypothetical protein